MDDTALPGTEAAPGVDKDQQQTGFAGRFPEPLSFLEDNTKFQVEAVYHDPQLEIPEYRNNPLILALPPFQSRLEMAMRLRQLYEVPHSDEYRSWSTELRIMALSRVTRNIVVQPVHIKLLEWCHQQIRQHYHQSPTLGAPPDLQNRYARQQRGSVEILEEPHQSHSSSIAIIGMSGVGKSTAAILALTQFPRVIIHKEFNSKPFRGAQLVWIYDVCPHNSSVGSLCRSILGQVDAHLGTFYTKEMANRKLNTADYVAKVAVVLKHHAVGLLVIDEIQNALIKQEERQMLDLLVNMLNSRACPVLFLGTPETALIAPKKSRLLRRVGAHEVRIDPFRKEEIVKDAKDAKIRDWFLESVTRLDFMPVPFSDKAGVYAALMAVSAGVPAFITQAWMITQHAGVTSEKRLKMVTPELVHAATRAVFGMVRGLLRAIELRDYKTLALMGDAAIGSLREQITHWVSDRESRAMQDAISERKSTVEFYSAVRTLIDLGIGKGDAEREVGIAREQSTDLDAKELVRRVLEKYRKPDFNEDTASGRSGTSAAINRDQEQGKHESSSGDGGRDGGANACEALGRFRPRNRNSPQKQEPARTPQPQNGNGTLRPDDVLASHLHPASEEVI
ncbi:ATP-binding protein [Paraburkholderia caribensis]|uniref:ATP-binding protein n=1 Tax=Paraburkholderia caribensis TaxID=75105 RepID=UPI001314748F|nr:ATP-binding protein [Paraburkholderia caribensis]